MLVRARAPLRISFSGGGTDLSPYAEEHGGMVLNATIDRYAYATLRFLPETILRVHSLDLETTAEFDLGAPLLSDGNLDLIKACLRRLVPQAWQPGASDPTPGLELYLETEAPPTSGLGASSALVVAIIGVLQQWLHLPLDRYQMAHLAWEIERHDVGIPGGQQDQYAAAFGGFNLMEFGGGTRVIVNPLRIEPRIMRELQYNLLLVFIGSRQSRHIIEQQVSGYVAQQTSVVEAMHRMKALTVEAKNALLTGRLDNLAAILHEEWLEKKRTAAGVSNARIEEIYSEARRLGALGGKISGAGGGGFMLLYCPFDRRPAVSERMVQLGGTVSPVSFEEEGMQSWTWGGPPPGL